MIKRLLTAIIVVAILVASLVSCAQKSENIVSAGVVSGESSDESVYTVEDAGLTYTQSDFDYFFKLQKSSFLSYYQYYQSMGYAVTPNNVAVDDTEEFWNADTGVKDDNGKSMTFGEYFYDYSTNAFKSHIARMILAKEYEIKYDDEFYSELNTAIAEDIVANELVPENEDVLDAKGNIPSWIMDRWEMHLASQKLDKDSWIEFNYTISKIDSLLMDILEEKGDIVAISKEDAKKEVEKLIDESIKSFLETNVKFKYIAYSYKVADDFKTTETSSEESADASATETTDDVTEEVPTSTETTEDTASNDDVSDVSAESTLSPEEQAKKYNEELKDKCDKIYLSLLESPEKFDSEVEKCDMADYILPTYKDGLVLEKANFKQVFGKECEDSTIGKIFKYETDVGVHIIMFVELKEEDSGISRTPTEEDITSQISNSLQNDYSAILEKYAERIALDDSFVAAYKIPWKV